jgi:WD40-like Beta Propeller Repeat
MRERLSTAAVLAVVGGVVVAAAASSLTGGSAARPASTHAATQATPAIGPPAPVQAQTGGTIVFGSEVETGQVAPGSLVVAPGEPGPAVRVDVGIRPSRPGAARIRVSAERLRLGPGVGTPSGERTALWAASASRPRLDGIYSRAVQGGALGRITTTRAGRRQQPLGYSPDGARLLFFQAGRNPQTGALNVISANGTGRIRLTPPGMTSWCCYLGAPASWGPSGRIAFAAFAPGAAGREGEGAVYVVNADGSGLRPITPRTRWATSARWSPDGRWIVFDQADRPGGAHDLFIVHPDGTALHRIATATGGEGSCCAQWSADSLSLLYSSGLATLDAHLWTVHLDGSGRRELSDDVAITEAR